LEAVGRIDVQWLLAAVDALLPIGGTTLAAGMATALQAADVPAPAELGGGRRHRRALFLTDMEDAGAEDLEALVAKQARAGLYVSFVGIGIDFNSDIAEQATRHPGANYFCVTGGDELQKVMVDEFDRNFFPTAVDVEVSVQSDVFDAAAVYGSPIPARREAVAAEWRPGLHRVYPLAFKAQARALLLCWRRCLRTRLPLSLTQRILSCLAPPERTVLRLGTVFPCRELADGSVEGGLILVQMAPCKDIGTVSHGTVRLALQYTTLEGAHVSVCQDHKIPLQASGAVLPPPSLVLRQGLLLRRYVEVCRRYLSASCSPHTTPAALETAFEDVEAFLAESDGELDICPGVRQDLEGFCRLAHSHCDELRWIGR